MIAEVFNSYCFLLLSDLLCVSCSMSDCHLQTSFHLVLSDVFCSRLLADIAIGHSCDVKCDTIQTHNRRTGNRDLLNETRPEL